MVSLVGWFGYRFWTLRDVWSQIYVLHDVHESEEARIRAAHTLSRDPRVEPGQLWELCLRRDLPDLARYVAGAGIGPALVAEDPWSYVSAVARSQDWPDWLRLVLAQPMAYAATQGHAISRERLGELCRQNDPILRLWALYSLAVQTRPDPQTVVELEKVAQSPVPERDLAELFLRAVRSDERGRVEILDQATRWTREHHRETVQIWKGWSLQGQELVRSATN
jgi:hypothetical protein